MKGLALILILGFLSSYAQADCIRPSSCVSGDVAAGDILGVSFAMGETCNYAVLRRHHNGPQEFLGSGECTQTCDKGQSVYSAPNFKVTVVGDTAHLQYKTDQGEVIDQAEMGCLY